MPTDLINGLLETGGAAFLALNLRQLYRDKEVRGIHWGSVMFTTVCCLWNVYLYREVALPISVAAAVLVVILQVWWLVLAWWFWKKDRTCLSA